MELPKVYFGKVSDEDEDEEKLEEAPEDNLDNDEDAPVSEDILAMIGFDPDKEDWDEE